MGRSEDAEAFFAAVYEAIQEIPYGRVTTYAHIARLIGTPQRPRQVGVCLKHLPVEAAESEFHEGNVPWQRVINSKGGISPRGPGSTQRQAKRLKQEGVKVEQNSMGEFTVDLTTYGWFPAVLPSEEGLDDSSSSDEDGDDDEDDAEEPREEAPAKQKSTKSKK